MPAEIARQKFSLICNGTTFNVIGFVVPSEGIRPLVTPMQTDSFHVSIDGCQPDVLQCLGIISKFCLLVLSCCQNCASFAVDVSCWSIVLLRTDLTSGRSLVKYHKYHQPVYVYSQFLDKE